MRKVMIILMLQVFLLTACTTTPETETLIEETEIVAENVENSNEFIVWGQSGLTQAIDEQMEAIFEERHPEIDVVFVDTGWDEALRQNFENSLQMGRPPEIVIGENYFRTFAASGDIQIVDDVLANYDDIIPTTYSGAEYNGNNYAVPYLTGIFAFERNCDVVELAGLDCDTPPQYWDELIEEARMITEAGAGEYYGYTLQGPGGTAVGSAFRIAVYQAQLDALPCADDACTVPDFNRPETLPVYEFLREMASLTPPGLIENPHEGEVYEALFRGVSAYQLAGSWHPGWAHDVGCDVCQYSPVPVSRDGNSGNLLVGNVLYAAPTNSAHPELALEWLEMLLSDEIQSQIFPLSGRLPVRTSILNELQPAVDEATAVFIDELLNNYSLRILPQWDKNAREIWQIYNDLLEAVLLSERPIADIMTEAQNAVIALEN